MREQQIGRKKLEMTRHSVALIEKMKRPYILTHQMQHSLDHLVAQLHAPQVPF